MSIRQLWIIDPAAAPDSNVLLTKHFPLVEKRSRKALGDDYCEIPDQLASLICCELGYSPPVKGSTSGTGRKAAVLTERTCDSPHLPPYYALCNGKLWPLLAYSENNLIYAALAYTDSMQKRLIEIAGTGVALELLESVSVYLASTTLTASVAGAAPSALTSSVAANETAIDQRLLKIKEYINVAIPFGTPTGSLDVPTVLSMVATADPKDQSYTPTKTKTSAWRPVAYRGKQLVTVVVKEQIRAVQYDHDGVPNLCHVTGSITCKADLDECPEVSLNTHASQESGALHSMLYHACAQLADEFTPVVSNKATQSRDQRTYETRKIRFTPPHGTFTLVDYTYRCPEGAFPMDGFFQMTPHKDSGANQLDSGANVSPTTSLQIQIQLHLAPEMKNSFEFCEVHVPFFNRAPVAHFTHTPSSANLRQSADGSSLVWVIGSRFSNETRTAALSVSVDFNANAKKLNANPNTQLQGLSSYILVHFKVPDFTFTGLRVDTKSVETYPPQKFKVQCQHELQTVEYKIWNTHGDVVTT